MSEDMLILDHIRQHGFITPAIAFTEYGCAALHSAAARLRKLHPIVCKMRHGNGKRWGEYRIAAQPEQRA